LVVACLQKLKKISVIREIRGQKKIICPRITLISQKKISVIREISGQKKIV